VVNKPTFVVGVDLDGVVADFYAYIRTVAAEWLGRDVSELTEDVQWGLPEWGLQDGDYDRLHHFALTQRDLFRGLAPITGAPQALRRLSREGVRLRVITHRLAVVHEHQTAILQTVKWLDYYGIPYWDLCFIKEKSNVGANLYLEDGPDNIKNLREALKGTSNTVIIYSNSTNLYLPDDPGGRADSWEMAEAMIRDRYYEWLDQQGLSKPPAPGRPRPTNAEKQAGS
jgi:hypothetical protein